MEQSLLIELEEALDRLSCGLNALKLMAYGLESTQDPFADGFHILWLNLSQAEGEIKALLDSVSAVRLTA